MISTNVFCSQQGSTLSVSIPRCQKSPTILEVSGKTACLPGPETGKESPPHPDLEDRGLRSSLRMERSRLTKWRHHTVPFVIFVSNLWTWFRAHCAQPVNNNLYEYFNFIINYSINYYIDLNFLIDLQFSYELFKEKWLVSLILRIM